MSKAKTNLGSMTRRVLAPVVWSPTLTWSRIRTPSMILTNPTMRAETALTLSSYIGSGLAMMYAASLLARARGDEEPVEWDPRSTDFGKIKIGNTRIDIYGDGGPYIRALAQLVFEEKKNQAGRLRTRPRIEVIKQFIRNKRAPIFDFIGKVWTGRTYYGGEAWQIPDWQQEKLEAGLIKEKVIEAGVKITETKAGRIAFLIGEETIERFAPFFVQSTLEAAWHDGTAEALMAGIDEFFSGQALSYKPSTFAKAQMLQDASALQNYNKLWDDLSPSEQKSLRNQIPEIGNLEDKADAELLPPEEISLREQNKAAKRIMHDLSKDLRDELKKIGISRISAPSRRFGAFWLNDERYNNYQEYIVEELNKTLPRSMRRALNEDEKRKHIREEINAAKKRARERLIQEIELSRS